MSRLAEELELIKNIYYEEISLESNLSLRFEYKLVKLVLKFNEDYPLSKPGISVFGNNIIEEQLISFSENLIGQEMIYELLEKFKLLVEEQKEVKAPEPPKIDIRSFTDETPFSKSDFINLTKLHQEDRTKPNEGLTSETGKQFFLNLKKKGYSEIENID